MKIAVICANGKEGKLIAWEAIARGADVTAVVRGENQSAAKQVIQKDLFDLNAADLEGFDVVVDAFGVDAGNLAAAQHFSETSLRPCKRQGNEASCCRRGGQPVCEPGAYRTGHGRGRLPGNVWAPCFQHGQGS